MDTLKDLRQQQRQERIIKDTANAKRDGPIRARFHAWLATEGFAPQETPMPGGTYPGAHTQMLWECYLAASLAKCKWIPVETPPVMKVTDSFWPKSDQILVFDGRDQAIAYLEQIDEDGPIRWSDAGSEGWTLTKVTHWMPLPTNPGEKP